MVKPEIISEQPMPMVDVLNALDKIKAKEKELNYRAQRTDEYVRQFMSIDKKKAKELIEKLNNLKITRLRDIHIYKIVDLMPMSVEDLRAILQAYTITIKAEDLKKIVAVVNEYAK